MHDPGVETDSFDMGHRLGITPRSGIEQFMRYKSLYQKCENRQEEGVEVPLGDILFGLETFLRGFEDAKKTKRVQIFIVEM